MDILTVALVTFFAGIIYILLTNGMTAKITFDEEEMRPMKIAYRLSIGDYAKSGDAMDSVYHTLKDQEIDELTGFGIYFDNPTETPKEQLRSLVGCVIKNEENFDAIEGVKHATLPVSTNLVTAFPYKNKFSIAMGAVKVYTALAKYRQSHDIPQTPVMEIYDVDNAKILYVVLTGIKKEFLEDLVKHS